MNHPLGAPTLEDLLNDALVKLKGTIQATPWADAWKFYLAAGVPADQWRGWFDARQFKWADPARAALALGRLMRYPNGCCALCTVLPKGDRWATHEGSRIHLATTWNMITGSYVGLGFCGTAATHKAWLSMVADVTDAKWEMGDAFRHWIIPNEGGEGPLITRTLALPWFAVTVPGSRASRNTRRAPKAFRFKRIQRLALSGPALREAVREHKDASPEREDFVQSLLRYQFGEYEAAERLQPDGSLSMADLFADYAKRDPVLFANMQASGIALDGNPSEADTFTGPDE